MKSAVYVSSQLAALGHIIDHEHGHGYTVMATIKETHRRSGNTDNRRVTVEETMTMATSETVRDLRKL